MKQLSLTDWIAAGLLAGGALVSIMAAVSGNDEGLASEFGGLLSWAAIAIAVYGFVTRSLKK